jgi:hypothetical protein
MISRRDLGALHPRGGPGRAAIVPAQPGVPRGLRHAAQVRGRLI